MDTLTLDIIGRVASPLSDAKIAPKQAHEGAPSAWLEFRADMASGLRDLRTGDSILLFTWLDRGNRATLEVHPRDDVTAPLRGVFSTRSADRPNPIGLHRVRIAERDGALRIRVDALEAIDGTPILDIKPALEANNER